MTTRLITPSIAEFPKFLKQVETKWQTKLARRFERERYVVKKEQEISGKNRSRYILSMFPYPSGRLHLGHVRIYTSGDILSRYSKLMVKNERCKHDYDHVIHPMGFDSFGLPAENAARERGLDPADWTKSNIITMKKQLDDLGLQFDWREATSNPNFYKWTQKIFIKLMDAGLVYKSFAQVNWDPIDKTVLADEQVDDEGLSWRSGAPVEKRFLRQWFVKVNALTNDIYKAEDVDPETWRDVLAIQRSWIGKPCGWLFYLPIRINRSNSTEDVLPIFTKNPELFASKETELVISSDHWLSKISNSTKINNSILNPFTGLEMKVIVTNDQDSLPSNTKATLCNPSLLERADKASDIKRQQILLQARLRNYGAYYTSDRYRDWLISRQRFWGTPIPVTFCNNCGYKSVAKASLPVKLPTMIGKPNDHSSSKKAHHIDDYRIVSPLEEIAPEDWLVTECSECGSAARRECETFDTLFDSSWYFLRYAGEPSAKEAFDRNTVKPVLWYVGGKEHASMHLFYARFMTHFLHQLGEIDFREPFKGLIVQGVVKSRTFKIDGKYVTKTEADAMEDKSKLVIEYEKMSKSKGNGVDPQGLIDNYGVDATRFCLMSYANPRSERLWRTADEEFKDVLSYLRRVTLTVQEYFDIGYQMIHKSNEQTTIKIRTLNTDEHEAKRVQLIDSRNKCSIDAIFYLQEANQFRQYISTLHMLTTAIRNNVRNSTVYTKEFAEALGALLVMLNPIIPHLTEELWTHFCMAPINPLKDSSKTPYKISMQIGDQAWPIPDVDYGRSHCVKPIVSK